MADLSKDLLLDMYRQMVLIRHFEEKCKELHQEGKIGGAYLHLYNGQEAVGVGAIRAIRQTDDVITAYRDHGIALVRGLDPKRIMAEMFGKRNGVSGGKGGSMHLADASRHFWGGHGIVGAHLTLATGIALKIKYLNESGIVLCFLGDGSTNNGYFHEAVNMSSIWGLPVVWLIENNLYGMGTSVDIASGQPELVKRAIAYGIKEGPRIDGMDVAAVYQAVGEAADYARHNGPILLEAMTYRFEGHGMSDKMFHTRVEEMVKYRDKDPILRMHVMMCDTFPDCGEKLDEVERETMSIVQEAIQFAEDSPDPTEEDLFHNVYA
jgi:pyruvate dehydrogenase E1 component alpha subunit